MNREGGESGRFMGVEPLRQSNFSSLPISHPPCEPSSGRDRPVFVRLCPLVPESRIDTAVAAACQRARATLPFLAQRSRAEKDGALAAIATSLRDHRREILEENRQDHQAARANGTSDAMLDRLLLNEARIEGVARAVLEVAELPDPTGVVVERKTRPNGLTVTRTRVPLGLIAIVYESRPNVTAEVAALTLKAGDAVVLRGGSEALRSNVAIRNALARALESVGFPEGAVTLLTGKDRDEIRALVQTEGVDLAIPRGGEGLIRFVTEHARVPVVQHYKGVCHLFVDEGADVEMAARLATDAKLSRPGVCNALECLLVDEGDAPRTLPKVAEALLAGGCELRGDDGARRIVAAMKAAHEGDFGHEFLVKVLAVKLVSGLEGALAHIARYGSQHTEAICTKDDARAARFVREVDAACVVVNASTRFHDGGELGLGAEIGIATSRVHWRGPMGLEALTTMKWIVEGVGQVRH
jgi:glutamate-5-semialdehyde dehydrogenase